MKRGSKGFTLTELMVVIMILGILAGLVMVAIQGAKEKANQLTCKNNLRQIGTNLQIYYTGEGRSRYYPTGGTGQNAKVLGRTFVISMWNPNDPSLQDEEIYVCPSATNLVEVASLWTRTTGGGKATSAYSSKDSTKPSGTEIETTYYGWDEKDASSSSATTPSSVTRAGTGFAIIVDQDATDGLPNHDKGMNCLFGDGHVTFLHFSNGFKDASDPQEKLDANDEKKVLPSSIGTSGSGEAHECLYIGSNDN